MRAYLLEVQRMLQQLYREANAKPAVLVRQPGWHRRTLLTLFQSIKGHEEEEDAYGGYGFYESSFGALDTLLQDRRPRNRSVGTKIAITDY